jgi:hypothetical protein
MMVTQACLGTMTWGSFNAKEEEAVAQLDRAIELGVNFLDTAELYPVAFNYGKTTEEWMGRWLSERVSQGKFKRADLYIAAKCNPSGVGSNPEGEESKPHSFESDILEQSCRMSIDRLQCEYIDLYQVSKGSAALALLSTLQARTCRWAMLCRRRLSRRLGKLLTRSRETVQGGAMLAPLTISSRAPPLPAVALAISRRARVRLRLLLPGQESEPAPAHHHSARARQPGI